MRQPAARRQQLGLESPRVVSSTTFLATNTTEILKHSDYSFHKYTRNIELRDFAQGGVIHTQSLRATHGRGMFSLCHFFFFLWTPFQLFHISGYFESSADGSLICGCAFFLFSFFKKEVGVRRIYTRLHPTGGDLNQMLRLKTTKQA